LAVRPSLTREDERFNSGIDRVRWLATICHIPVVIRQRRFD
jgi:hypothetical protein